VTLETAKTLATQGETSAISFTKDELVTLLWCGVDPLESGALGWLLCAPDRDDIATICERGMSSLGAHGHLPGTGMVRSLSRRCEAVSLLLRTATTLVLYRSVEDVLLAVVNSDQLGAVIQLSMPNVFEFRMFVPERSIDEQIKAQLGVLRSAGLEQLSLTLCRSLVDKPVELVVDPRRSIDDQVDQLSADNEPIAPTKATGHLSGSSPDWQKQ
jgi:hypothetical protein